MKTLADSLRNAKAHSGTPEWSNRPDDPRWDSSRVNCTVGAHDRSWAPCDDREVSEWSRKRRELDCSNPQTLVCLACGDCLWVRCRSSRRSRCASCSVRWLRRQQHEMREALTSALRSGREMWVLTVTFPGFGGCKHWCACHEARQKFGADVGVWNGTFTERFNDLVTEVRRLLGVDVQYERCLEPQKGDRIKDGHAPTWAFHGHVALAVAVQSTRGASLATWSKSKWRKLLAAHGFGHSFVLRPIECREDAADAVRYVTGYAKNVADELRAAPYVHPVSGERQPSRCRAFTSSRMFAETAALMRYRFAAQCRRADEVRRAEVERMSTNIDAVDVGDGDGAAGALEGLFDELRIRGMIDPESVGF